MRSFMYTITDPLGIHARPAGLLARVAGEYGGAVITVEKDGKRAKASQLLKLMGLGVKKGDVVTVSAEGSDEDAAIAAMEDFFRQKL